MVCFVSCRLTRIWQSFKRYFLKWIETWCLTAKLNYNRSFQIPFKWYLLLSDRIRSAWYQINLIQNSVDRIIQEILLQHDLCILNKLSLISTQQWTNSARGDWRVYNVNGLVTWHKVASWVRDVLSMKLKRTHLSLSAGTVDDTIDDSFVGTFEFFITKRFVQ